MEQIIEHPPVPAWAYFSKLHQGCEMRRGDELLAGDTVYFSLNAYPRVLWAKLNNGLWSVTVQTAKGDRKERTYINPHTFYLTRREQPATLLNFVRVDGYALAAGDVLWIGGNVNPRRVKITLIDPETHDPQRGPVRRAIVAVHGCPDTEHVFGGFSMQLFQVVGGPKLDAARKNPSLTKFSPVGPVWIGAPDAK